MNRATKTWDALLGSWSLVRTDKEMNGQDTGKVPLGEGAYGWLHYLPDGRMMVIMANAGREPMSAGRYNSDEAETANSARTFTAFAGTFSVRRNDVMHHLDICRCENDRGTDYVRHASLAGDFLALKGKLWEGRRGTIYMGLDWRRTAQSA